MSHLQISKHISADFLAAIEKDFESILVQRNASLQNRVEKSKFYRLMNLSGLLLSGLGLLLSLLAATMSFGP